MLRIVRKGFCDDLFAVRSFGSGHWTNPFAELFSQGDAPPVHIHVYNQEKSREAYKLGKMKVPSTVLTVSYETMTPKQEAILREREALIDAEDTALQRLESEAIELPLFKEKT